MTMMMMMKKDAHTRRVIKQEEPPQPPPPPPTYDTIISIPGGGSVASPPLSSSSSSSSPSHDDFSFTISLHPSSTDLPAADGAKTKPSTPSFTAADDLSPAGDIFLHGHLLPLRLLSHLPISPRSSTNSVDSFTLPIIKNFQSSTNTHLVPKKDTKSSNKDPKPKSPFSFFRLSKLKKEISLNDRMDRSKTDPTVIKGFRHHSYLDKEEKDDDDKEKQWKKLKFEIAQAVKRYVRMMKPLLSSFKSGGGGGGGVDRRKVEVDRKAHSFSSETIRVTTRGSRSDNNIINKRSAAAAAFRGGRRGLGVGEYSAPASTRTSPTNSGLLVAPPRPPPPSESTMEELQAAIQAAIAHCKKSVAVEEGEDQRKSNATVA